MIVTVLAENTVAEGGAGLRPEQGLSLHLALGHASILYDAGASGLFADNAARMGIDLAAVDLAVVSHGHYDHAGGLMRFLELNQRAVVHMHSRAADPHYVKVLFRKHDASIPPEVFRRHPDRIRFIDGFTEAGRDAFLLTDIGKEYPWVKFNRTLQMGQAGRAVPDTLQHEIVLVVREADGLVVFTGCGHNGVLNMVDAARTRFPGTPIKAVLGGFHLMGIPGMNILAEDEASVRRIGRTLLDQGIGRTYTGHCTGAKAFRTLKAVMGSAVDSLATGSRIEI
jgi:7,8-dihydropterin-6-yl-methyl-4-(beta-D-ribofuranosyl)aminobenzene 5'-phosphate synthase